MELDHDLDRAETDHPPEAGEQIHPTVTRAARVISTSGRYAFEPGIGKRDRLNNYGLDPPALRSGAKQRGLERQDPVGVAACSLRQQYQGVSSGQPWGSLV